MADIQLRDVLLRGLRVRYAEVGSGPPLVLVHGLLVDHREYKAMLPLLAPHFRCIAIDLPGAGGSEKRSPGTYPYTREAFAETVADLMSALDLPRAHVVGHSMGGGIALTLAADRPELVDRLVVIDSMSYAFEVPLKGRIPLVPIVGPFVFKKLYGRSMLRDYFRREVWSEHAGMDLAQVDAYFETFDPPDARDAGYASLVNTVSDVSSLGPKIGRIRAPTLVIWADDDRLLPLALGQRLSREIPGARLRVVANSGHAPNEEHPEETAKMVIEHLQGEAG